MKKFNKAYTAKKEINTAPKTDVFQMITDRIITALEGDIIPWKKPWSTQYGGPRNYVTKHAYQGINAFLLGMVPAPTPYFMTYKQAQELGGNVIKGSKGMPVIFYSVLEKEDRTSGEKERIPFVKYSTVFNISQIEGIEFKLPEKVEREHTPTETAEEIINNFLTELNGPKLKHGDNSAYYHKALDFVMMPEPKTFISSEHYYSVLFHELTHSSGNKKRLNRPDLENSTQFGSAQYAREELTAEMGAAFLCGIAGLDISNTIQDSTAYIQSWLKALKNDKKLVFQAASQAQKAAYHITGTQAPTYEEAPAAADLELVTA